MCHKKILSLQKKLIGDYNLLVIITTAVVRYS
jgi:hypothetical protein